MPPSFSSGCSDLSFGELQDALNTIWGVTSKPGRGVLGLLPLPAVMMKTTNALLSFVVITFMFAVIYKLLPDVKIAWRNVWTVQR